MGFSWDEGSARAVVKALVERQLGLFAAHKGEFGRDDLESEGLTAARNAWPNYKPALAAPSTFINLVAHRRLLDISRKLKRRHTRESHAMQLHADRQRTLEKPQRETEEPETLADWLGQTYRFVRLIYTRGSMPLRPPGANHRYPDRAQRAALLLLKRRLGASSRGLVLALAERPALLDVIEMHAIPTDRTIRNLEKSGKRLGMTLPPLCSN